RAGILGKPLRQGEPDRRSGWCDLNPAPAITETAVGPLFETELADVEVERLVLIAHAHGDDVDRPDHAGRSPFVAWSASAAAGRSSSAGKRSRSKLVVQPPARTSRTVIPRSPPAAKPECSNLNRVPPGTDASAYVTRVGGIPPPSQV